MNRRRLHQQQKLQQQSSDTSTYPSSSSSSSPSSSLSASCSSASSLSVPTPSSIYPLTPRESQVLVRFAAQDYTVMDKVVVVASSLFFVGGVFWVPVVYGWLLRKYKQIPSHQRRRKIIYGSILAALTLLYLKGPHRRPTFGEKYANVHSWSLWKSWMRFFAFEIVADNIEKVQPLLNDRTQAILGITPHGIFPFGLAFAALSDQSAKVFGKFHAVVATATYLVPWIRDVLCWVRAVDASRPSVDRALQRGQRLGLAPGGIDEMLQDTNDQTEYAIVKKGIFRMAIKHNVPIIPIYCFGSSLLLKKFKLPSLVERIGLMLRMSLVMFFGQYGLPVPFRQRLLYVIGNPIHPACGSSVGEFVGSDDKISLESNVERMYEQYCWELKRIFDTHKESYAAGWNNKKLSILTEK